MEKNPNRLGENYKQLVMQMEKLGRMRDDVVSTGKRGKDGWLKDVKEMENEFHEFVEEYDSTRKNYKNVSNLNKKVLELLKVVQDLQEKGNGISPKVETVFRELDRMTPKKYIPGDLSSITSNYSQQIGRGGFGDVYEGHLDSGEKVAVKVLRESRTIEESFLAEVDTMFRARHRRLITLYGFCFDRNKKALVYEYMENRSLDEILYKNPKRLDWEIFYEIATETASGLAYLHEYLDKQIIHLDVKPANVLLSAGYMPKLTDFGLAKLVDNDATHATLSHQGKGTAGFIAPEILLGKRATCKSDVYSFGKLLFEILGMRRNSEPVDEEAESFPEEVWEMFREKKLDQLIQDCGIKEKSRENAERVAMVALICVQWNPKSRPKMSTVAKMLEKEMLVPVLSQNPFHPSAEPSMPPIKEEPFHPSAEPWMPPIKEEVHSKVTPSLNLAERKPAEKVTGDSSNAQRNGYSGDAATEHSASLRRPKVYSVKYSEPEMPRSSKGPTPNKQGPNGSGAGGSDSILTPFALKCPPGGENSVIVYTSSWAFTVTCQEVLSILRAHKVEVIERDVYNELKYKDELIGLLGRLEIPALFVMGRYIGGAVNVRKLDKNGVLSNLFDEVRKEVAGPRTTVKEESRIMSVLKTFKFGSRR